MNLSLEQEVARVNTVARLARDEHTLATRRWLA
jgi:hypothetical protein